MTRGMSLFCWFLLTHLSVSTLYGRPLLSDDDQLAMARSALIEIGADLTGSTNRCSGCHALETSLIRSWGKSMNDLSKGYLENGDLTPAQKIAYLRGEDGFNPKVLGLWAAKADHDVFRALFQQAYPEGQWQKEFSDFVAAAKMPRGRDNPMSADGFAKVRTWVGLGMPKLDEALARPPRLETCRDESSELLQAHLRDMSTKGWHAHNLGRSMRMFGCTDQDPLHCFQQTRADGKPVFSVATEDARSSGWARRSVDAMFRILVPKVDAFYWIRSSSNGRFVGDQNKIYDLAGSVSSSDHLPRVISIVNGSLDPNFFPDDSGFSFLKSRPERPVFCPQRLLEDPNTHTLNMTDPACVTFDNVDVYLYLGGALGGGDYYAMSGTHVNDSGRSAVDPSGLFSSSSAMRMYWIVNNGRSFSVRRSFSVSTSYEGDWAMTASGRLAAGRASNDNTANKHNGYALRYIRQGVDGNGQPTITAERVGRVCMLGGKASFSFNERSLAVHHYVTTGDFAEHGYASARDPAFVSLVNSGTSNIYLADLITGRKIRITNMLPGQRALFPHFRSDGWLYFLVKSDNESKQYVVGTDAALKLWQGSL